MSRLILSLTLAFSLLGGQTLSLPALPSGGQKPSVLGWVTVSGTQFLEGSSKPLLLHGINAANKSPDQGYVGDLSPNDYASI
jgi:hypothetical protein